MVDILVFNKKGYFYTQHFCKILYDQIQSLSATRPLDVFPKDEEMEIVVDKDNHSAKSDDEDKLNVSGSDTDEPKSESAKTVSDSPCTNGSYSFTGSSSPRSSPVNLFKKNSSTPSAFHHLVRYIFYDKTRKFQSVDSSRPNFVSPHVSPADTHSSASPDGVPNCFDCAMSKTKLTMAENKCRYLESRANTLQVNNVKHCRNYCRPRFFYNLKLSYALNYCRTFKISSFRRKLSVLSQLQQQLRRLFELLKQRSVPSAILRSISNAVCLIAKSRHSVLCNPSEPAINRPLCSSSIN